MCPTAFSLAPRCNIHMWFLQIAKPCFYDSHIPSVRKCRMENGWVKIIDYWPTAWTKDTRWEFFFWYPKSKCLANQFDKLWGTCCKNWRCSYILQDFLFVFGIWIWAVENLGHIHHVSVLWSLSRTTYSGFINVLSSL